MVGWNTPVCQCPTAKRNMPIGEVVPVRRRGKEYSQRNATELLIQVQGAESGGSPAAGEGAAPTLQRRPHSRNTAMRRTQHGRRRANSRTAAPPAQSRRYRTTSLPPSRFRQILVRACHHTTPRCLPCGGHPPAAHKDSHRRAALRH